MSRTYLYGVIAGSDEAALAVPDVDGAGAVRTVARDGLGCVVSDYGGADFGALPREELVRKLLAHQQVVEHIMQHQDVLPVKFGTLLNDSQEVLDLLHQCHAPLAPALASLRGKVEMEVAATWDPQRVFSEIATEETVVRAREEIASKDQPALEERLRLGQMVKASMDRRRESYRERILRVLKPLALDVIPNALLSEKMVMNVALLIDKSRQREFAEGVNQLDALFGNEILLRVIGPLPPYSFSSLEVTRVSGEQVEGARLLLGLGESFSEAEVGRARRRLAAQAQSRLERGDEEAKARLAQVRDAAELLLRCSGGGLPPPEGKAQPALLTRATSRQNRWLVSLRRARSEEVEPGRFGAAA